MASILGDVALPRVRIYTIIDLCWEKKNIELNKETSFLVQEANKPFLFKRRPKTLFSIGSGFLVRLRKVHMEVSINGGHLQNGWFIVENPI